MAGGQDGGMVGGAEETEKTDIGIKAGTVYISRIQPDSIHTMTDCLN